ncbi:MAG: HEPN domain-containing protein [Candidatus Latescibacteria bacterium]|nr:HEPN domain-containing protein [Candidatus Latescibacterota bacterium]
MTEFPEQYEIFLKKARSDLALAKIGYNAHDSGVDQATLIFHLQQAAEKLIKAILAFSEVHFEKTHDIRMLMDLCVRSGIELPHYVKKLMELNPYAVIGRYDIVDVDESCLKSIFR